MGGPPLMNNVRSSDLDKPVGKKDLRRTLMSETPFSQN